MDLGTIIALYFFIVGVCAALAYVFVRIRG